MVGGFLETGKDAAIVLDLIKKAFDEMTFLMKMPVVGPIMQAVGTGWKDCWHPAIRYDLHKRIGIVNLIADDGFSRERIDPSFRLADVGCLTAGEDEGQGIAQGVGHGMNLGAKAPRERPNACSSAELCAAPRRAGVGANNSTKEKARSPPIARRSGKFDPWRSAKFIALRPIPT